MVLYFTTGIAVLQPAKVFYNQKFSSGHIHLIIIIKSMVHARLLIEKNLVYYLSLNSTKLTVRVVFDFISFCAWLRVTPIITLVFGCRVWIFFNILCRFRSLLILRWTKLKTIERIVWNGGFPLQSIILKPTTGHNNIEIIKAEKYN